MAAEMIEKFEPQAREVLAKPPKKMKPTVGI